MQGSELVKARQAHQELMVLWAKRLLFCGIGMFVVAAGLGFAHNVLPANGIDPAIGIVPGILGVLLFGSSAVCTYYGQPIPNEPLHGPSPFHLEADQRWRQRTELRLLEKLKGELATTEKCITECHERALTAYQHIQQAVSFAAYKAAKARLGDNEAEKQRLLLEIPTMRERIERIASGDVGHELLDTEEQIAKLSRQKQEIERKLAALKVCTIRHKTDEEENQCKRDRRRQQDYLLAQIYTIDVAIIERETHIKELRSFDFRKLWKELDLPGSPELGRVPNDTIGELRQKAETVNAIPDLKSRKPAPAPPPQVSREEIRKKKISEIEATRKRYREERQERTQNARTELEAKRWDTFYDHAEYELDEELKKWLR